MPWLSSQVTSTSTIKPISALPVPTPISQIQQRNRSKWSTSGEAWDQQKDTSFQRPHSQFYSQSSLESMGHAAPSRLPKLPEIHKRPKSGAPSLVVGSAHHNDDPMHPRVPQPRALVSASHRTEKKEDTKMQYADEKIRVEKKIAEYDGERGKPTVDLLSSVPTTNTSMAAQVLIETCCQLGWTESAQHILKESQLDQKQERYLEFQGLLRAGAFSEVHKRSRTLLLDLEPVITPPLVRAGHAWLDFLHHLSNQSFSLESALGDNLTQLWVSLDLYLQRQESHNLVEHHAPFLPFLAYITWPPFRTAPVPTSRADNDDRMLSNSLLTLHDPGTCPSSLPSATSTSAPVSLQRVDSALPSHAKGSSETSVRSAATPPSSTHHGGHGTASKVSHQYTWELQSVHEHLPISILLMDVAFFNGDLIVAFSGKEDRHVYLWNLTQCCWLHKWLPQSSKSIFFLTFSPSARYLVTTDLDCDVTVYDWLTRTETRKRKWHTRVIHRVYIETDEAKGLWVSCSSDHSMKLWSGHDPRVGRIHGTHPFLDAVVHGHRLLALQPFRLRVYQLASYLPLYQIPLCALEQHKSPARRLYLAATAAATMPTLLVASSENMLAVDLDTREAAETTVHFIHGRVDVATTATAAMAWAQAEAILLTELGYPKRRYKLPLREPCQHLRLIATSDTRPSGTVLVTGFEKEIAVYVQNESSHSPK